MNVSHPSLLPVTFIPSFTTEFLVPLIKIKRSTSETHTLYLILSMSQGRSGRRASLMSLCVTSHHRVGTFRPTVRLDSVFYDVVTSLFVRKSRSVVTDLTLLELVGVKTIVI